MYSIKWAFLAIFGIFEVGSLVCALAPNSNALIVGRAVAGLGAAGIFTGVLTVIANITPVQQRPTIIGVMTGLYPFCNIIAPLVRRTRLSLCKRSLNARRLAWWCVYGRAGVEVVLLHQP